MTIHRSSSAHPPSCRPRLEQLEVREVLYAVSGNAWPHPERVTISFVPDGTDVGGVASNLFSVFNARFGSAATWQKEIVRAAQVWAQQTNLNFSVVPDNGAPLGGGDYLQGDPGFGDIRIGGFNFGTSTLAQAYLPPPVNNYSVAGDMQFNTAQTWNVGSAYDLFTVAVHEFGHVLGLYHSGIISANMAPGYNGTKTTLTSDDIAGIRAVGGGARGLDAYDTNGSNSTYTTADNVTALLDPVSKAARIPDLDITATNDVDFYKIVVPAGSASTLQVRAQSSGLSLLNVKLSVLASNGSTVLGSASAGGLNGGTASVSVGNVTAGQVLYIKVQGMDTTAMSTGEYSLNLNLGTGPFLMPLVPTTQVLNGNPLSSGGGQPTRVVEEVGINSYTSGTQQGDLVDRRAVATDASGNSVIVWTSDGQDGNGWGVYGRRLDGNGAPRGNDFRVNTTTNKDQRYPAVAMAADGCFVVVWASTDQDGGGLGVYGQRYNADGTVLGSEFRVATATAGDQTNPVAALDASKNILVSWTGPGTNRDIFVKKYNWQLSVLVSDVRVNAYTANDQMNSDVACDDAGNFVVTWQSKDQDGGGWGVYARKFNAAGTPLAAEFAANTTTSNDQISPSVAMSRSGDFVVSWSSKDQDGDQWGVYARTCIAATNTLSAEFLVNSTTKAEQQYSSVAVDSLDHILITWQSKDQDGGGWGIYAQQVAFDTTRLGSEFRVNTTTAGDQQSVSLGIAPNGTVVVAWSGSCGRDSSGIIAQWYKLSNSNAMSLMEAAVGVGFEAQPMPALPVRHHAFPAHEGHSDSNPPLAWQLTIAPPASPFPQSPLTVSVPQCPAVTAAVAPSRGGESLLADAGDPDADNAAWTWRGGRRHLSW